MAFDAVSFMRTRPGCAELHLGRGKTPRPDTLAQTGQITSHKPLADGAGHTFLNASRSSGIVIVTYLPQLPPPLVHHCALVVAFVCDMTLAVSKSKRHAGPLHRRGVIRPSLTASRRSSMPISITSAMAPQFSSSARP